MQTKKGKKVVLINFLIHVICISAFIKYTDQLFGCRRVYLFFRWPYSFPGNSHEDFFFNLSNSFSRFFQIQNSAKPQLFVSHQWKTIWSKNRLIDNSFNIFNKYTFNGKMYSRINFCRKEKKILKYFTQKIS